MKKVFLSFAVILLLIACNFPFAAPQMMTPTALSAGSQPIPVQTSAAQGQSELTGTTWMWIGFTGPNDQVAVETPMNYSLVFQPGGSVNITADCNNAQASYQVDGQSIKIQVGAMTKAMCPVGSHSDQFLQYLENAAIYFIQDGNLYMDLAADGGTMVFAPSEEVLAEDGSGALSSALQANPWQWVSFTNPVEQYDVESSQNYLLTFHDNGTVDIKSDCNTASGTYMMDGSKISIVVSPATMAACPPGSRSEEFIKHLGSAAIYFFQPGELFIDLMADGGTMRFTPVGP